MPHALIIEDDWLVAFSVQDALSKLGYSTFEIVDSMREAVEAAHRACPDLVVADHQITDGTGTDAVLAICSDKPIPVVWVTASGPEVRKRVPDALIVDKPFNVPGLHAAIRVAVERPFQNAPATETN
jgi:DNA-binding response OmpR family regulator